MIAWLNPLALWGTVAALGVVVVHHLTRQRATRLPFPSVRFIHTASTAAIRLRRPSDGWLLLLRVGVIAAAAVALAQPMVVTSGRRGSWDARLSRAIVVDTSRSMTPFAPLAGEAAAGESQSTTHSIRIDTEQLGDGLAEAADRLTAAPPSAREIVVISDFQNGSLTSAEIATVPGDVGLRFVQVGRPSVPPSFRGDVALGAPGVGATVQQVTATPDATTVRLTSFAGRAEGLRLAASSAAADSLLRVVARAGAPGPARDQPMAFVFATTPANDPNRAEAAVAVQARMPAWMVRTIVRMQRDPALAEAAREHKPSAMPVRLPPLVVAHASHGVPVAAATAHGSELVFLIAAAPGDFLSAATLRAALVARRGSPEWGENEAAVIPSTQLTAWTRQPAPPSTMTSRGSRGHSPGDARLIWVAVLLLLGLETIVRGRRKQEKRATHVKAA